MSIEVSATVWKHAPVDGSAMLLLLALADFADEDGGCWPSIATLADRARCSERTVQRGLAEMEQAGFIAVETGSGPRGCNRYFVRVEAIRAASRARKPAAAEAAKRAAGTPAGGDNLTPPDSLTGVTSVTGGVTPMTPGGDTHVTRTVIEPPIEPPLERERAREDLKKQNHAFAKAHDLWPTRITDSAPQARKAWDALGEDERAAAVAGIGRYVEASRAAGRRLVCAFGVYLSERRWQALPAEAAPVQPDTLVAPAFGPLWQAARLKKLLAGPTAPARLTATTLALVEAGTWPRDVAERASLAASGYPQVNGLHELAANGRGVAVPAVLATLAAALEPVPVSSPRMGEWQALHKAMGWPWLPDTGRQQVVYWPKGENVQAALAAFEAALRTLPTTMPSTQPATQPDARPETEADHAA